jgi:hypothetical protein
MPTVRRGLVLSALLAPALAQGQWTLTLLDPTAYPQALCLDGSQGGFYFSPGVGDAAKNFVIHTQGGGWCTSDGDCAGRAKSALGSSAGWARGTVDCPNSGAPVCYADGGSSGMIANASAANPPLWDWSKVFINYCDGGCA